MRPSVRHSAFTGLLALALSPLAVAQASSPPDSVHYCVPFDYEQWRGDHPRPAAKGLADRNAGEPRTVRMIHFLPNDRPYRVAAVDEIESVIRQIQTFYAGQMQAHGYGHMTFRYETDGQGEPLVHRLNGQRPDREYTGTTVLEEVERAFDLDANLYLIVLDSEPPLRLGGDAAAGTGDRWGKSRGFGMVPDLVDGRVSWDIAAHELGHAFGLFHEFGDDAYIMSYGESKNRLSACSAEFLAVHPYFNSDVPIEEGSPPGVELLSPTAYPADSESVSIRVEVGDAEGVHQVLLASQFDVAVKGCRDVAGRKEAVVEFEYDGAHPRATWMNLSDPVSHPIFFGAVDRDGNVHEQHYILTAASPHHIATLEGHTGITDAVAFSPDGTLASGSADGTIRLWDAASRRSTATLTEHSSAVHSVAFSPDGTALASGSADGTVRLWDAASGRSTATLTEHSSAVHSVAFSPDGTALASGSADHTIVLWDVAERIDTATLEGHAGGVHSVAFSPDGATVASGSADGTVKLWDVETGDPVGTLEGHSYPVNSVTFSPDGTTLASGSGDNTVKLWNVAARADIATLSECRNSVESLAFSPDGATLAAASRDRRVVLWDVATRKWIEAFAQTSTVEAIAFSPDGTTLASGGGDGRVTLWDTSEWAGPRPFRVVMISGDGQRGAPGEALSEPLVVEVRDQYGNLLPEAPVVFTVTEGGGKLSGRFTVERTVTDDRGRVALPLTLGPAPGAIAVEVSLGAGSEVLTFRAEGIVTDVAGQEGDYRTWHLPEQARVRLGTGNLSDFDRSLAFSPNGRMLAVASGIGLWLYDAAMGRALALLPTGQVHSVAFSPNGATLASGGSSSIRLWDVRTREEIAALQGHTEAVRSLAFSPDGATLASTVGYNIRLWDMESREEIATLQGHAEAVRSLAFSPDGAILVSGSGDDGTIRLWDVESREEIATLQGHTEVHSLAFSPDGATLASAGGFIDPTLKLWDVATRAHVATLASGHFHGPYSLSFAPDGATVAAGMSGAIWVWDVTARELINTIETETVLPQASTGVRSVVFSPDGTMLASAGPNTFGVTLWDVGTWSGVSLGEHANRILSGSVSFSPDGAMLASSSGRVCRLWDLATGAVTLRLVGGGVFSLSPDGALLALGSHEAIKLWDVGTQEEIASLPVPSGWIGSVSFSPDGAILASGSGGAGDGTVRLWDVGTREEIASLEGHLPGSLIDVRFSPDGAILAVMAEGRVMLWDVETRREVASLEGRPPAFSPDGTLLALWTGDGVKLWDVETRKEIASLGGLGFTAFSPDGALLAVGWDRVKLWDMGTRMEIASLEGGPFLAFSPDGSLLATGSSGGTVKLWDVQTREEIVSLQGDRQGNGVTFSPDGATLVSSSETGTVVLWDVELLLQSRPQTLAKLSGDAQHRPAGSALAEPFVVLVRDQSGSPLAGATVTFAVTAGDGTLSATTAATDARGRAATTLTLGPQPGTNTVEAIVDRLQPVIFSAVGRATATTLDKLSGDEQQGPAGTSLAEPFVVEIRDQTGAPHAGVAVTFSVTAGGGTLSVTSATTDADGRAATTLTLDRQPGTNTVRARVPGLQPVTFTATGEATPDFDGDGVTDFSDFFLFAEAFGGSDPRFDLDGSGTVDFADFFLFAESFGRPARAKLLALAREQIGLPDGPQLRQNAPNPFNNGTVISWFQLQPGPARVEVFALTGQRVAVLTSGHRKAGLHRLHWDGRDEQGRPSASGIYVYRLATAGGAWTRKLTLLR